MANKQSIKRTPLGLEWVQLDASRELLCAFTMVQAGDDEPVIQTTACTVPNVSGHGDPNTPLYAMRMRDLHPMMSPTKSSAPTSAGSGTDSVTQKGPSLVKKPAASALDSVPGRGSANE